MHRAWKWNRADEESAYRIAELSRGPAFALESLLTRPPREILFVVMGKRTGKLLSARCRRDWSSLCRGKWTCGHTHTSLRAPISRQLGPMHPLRLAEYDEQFAARGPRGHCSPGLGPAIPRSRLRGQVFREVKRGPHPHENDHSLARSPWSRATVFRTSLSLATPPKR